ncbi:hypothetical protein SFRURICE_004532 [Spodoptera frugiperda]|nr:hypothetical protein SFRURICE_004532 [Spodoptera frugiperda]
MIPKSQKWYAALAFPNMYKKLIDVGRAVQWCHCGWKKGQKRAARRRAGRGGRPPSTRRGGTRGTSSSAHLPAAGPRGASVAWVRAAAAGPGRPLVRLKPCLSVCQLVEQHCPYFLPADRAPAYPTQYAGEPTFLCLDPRIPETGAQANKSNYGRDECCYWYCEGRLCYRCELRLSESQRPEAERCPAVEERVAGCSVPYQAAAAGSAPRPRPRLLLALLLLGLAAHARTHWTAATRLVKVRDSRL